VRTRTRNCRTACIGALVSAVTLLCMAFAAPALAVPQLGLTLDRTPAAPHRNDEHLTYTLTVKNTASAVPQVGDELSCDGQFPLWFPKGEPQHGEIEFSYRWVRNGVPIPGAEGEWPEPPLSPTYILTAADAGKSIQCLVTGANEFEPGVPAVNSFASQPPIVVSPAPVPAPPQPEHIFTRPEMSGSAPGKFLCTSPSGEDKWIGDQITWSFRWMRNGTYLGEENVETTPTSSTYNVQPGEFATPATLQCEAIAKDAAGNEAVVISLPNGPNSPTQQPAIGISVEEVPTVNFSNTTNGPVTLELELPSGQETRVFRIIDPLDTVNYPPKAPAGWSCTIQQPSALASAKVTCTRSDLLSPGGSYPGVKVFATIGADAPEPTVETQINVSGGGSDPASVVDSFEWLPANPFEIKTFTTKAADPDGNDLTQAGGHPTSASADFKLTTHVRADGAEGAIEHVRNLLADLPAGLLGNPEAVPATCDSVEKVLADRFAKPTCPRESIVGGVQLRFAGEGEGEAFNLPIYRLDPERGVPAQFSFALVGVDATYALVPRLRADDGYALSLDAPEAPTSPILTGARVTVCGYGAKVRNDPTDTSNSDFLKFDSCKKAEDPDANPKPLLTNPTRCAGGAPVTTLSADSWENPAPFAADGTPILSDPRWRSKDAVSPEVTGCEEVPFEPTIELKPTSRRADSPTGLDVSVSVPTEGLETPGAISQAALKRAVVTLPKGMTVNPAAADGLGACTSAEIGVGANDPVRCPDSSKIGSATVQTPLLKEELNGSVYLAKQKDNPFGSLLALYLVVESRERGILVKIPGRVGFGPDGRLVSSFDDNPQLPFGSLQLHFKGGDRAPLVNPPLCGTHRIEAVLSPWSAADPDNPSGAEQVKSTSSFKVSQGPNGGPCPDGSLQPKLEAILRDFQAGSKSPFVLSLSRPDASQRFSGVTVENPEGLTAYLKGVPYCPDSALASISGAEGTGAAELASPSCPAASRVGSVSAGAGAGPSPFYVDTGKAYLAGPYKGAPISLAILTPALAGPFDLGSVLVRTPLYVDPVSARVKAVSDPIPTALHGIALDVRDIRVALDRPGFTAAPTNCEPMAVSATVSGELGASATVSERFQVGGCENLGFKPKLALRLFGPTGRGGHPRLKATLTARPGDANIAGASVALPHSEFLDQSHIRTICTRVQFAAKQCPAGSVYGRAEATTPLLDQPLSGPVYLRSSSNPLPDLVAALEGPDNQPIEVVLAGRIDSVKGGIRSSFEAVPDQPVSRFVLQMQGGKKGLLVNSRDLCKSVNRASATFTAQSGKVAQLRPKLKSACGKRKRHAR
jgi:hypothetical protein